MPNDLGDLLKVLIFILIVIGSIVSQIMKDRKTRVPRSTLPRADPPEVIVFGGPATRRGPRPPAPPRQYPPDTGDDLFRRLAGELGVPEPPRPRAARPPPELPKGDRKRRMAAHPAASAPFSAGVAPPVLTPAVHLVRAERAVRAKGIGQKRSRAAVLLGSGSAGLRRAILAQEILGSPRALRGY